MKYHLGEKKSLTAAVGWSREVTLEDGRVYRVGVERGKAVRIAQKPRGENIGHKYWGFVVSASDGREVWRGDVPGTLGARGLLWSSGVLDEAEEAQTPAPEAAVPVQTPPRKDRCSHHLIPCWKCHLLKWRGIDTDQRPRRYERMKDAGCCQCKD